MPTRRSYSGVAPATRITTDLASGGTSFVVEDGTGYPTGSAGPFFVLLDRGLPSEEKLLIGSRSGTTFTVAASGRGQDGTIAAAHSAQATVEHTVTAVDLDEANAHTTDVGDPHPQYLSVGDTPYRIRTATDNTPVVITSTTFGGTGPDVTFTVPESLLVVVLVSAQLSGSVDAIMGFDLFDVSAGALANAAVDSETLYTAGATSMSATRAVYHQFSPGQVGHVFQARSRYKVSSGTATFLRRNLTVIPSP